MPTRRLLLTCEHGGNRIPRRYARYFRDAGAALASHLGYDLGALDLARRLAHRFQAPLYGATISRLLVDLNRSPGHPRLFSVYVSQLGQEEKKRIIEEYYLPHRNRVEDHVRRYVEKGEAVLHLAVHSFVPELNGTTRSTDIGLLYDPARSGERALSRKWARGLRRDAPVLRVHCNAPYRGTSDSLTTFLRRRFASRHYWGVELEVNQEHLAGRRAKGATVERAIEHSLTELFA